MPKTVHLSYFALIREERGVDHELIETESETVSELYRELKAAHGLSLDENSLKVSINDDVVSWDTLVSNDDHIVFIPPVSGG